MGSERGYVRRWMKQQMERRIVPQQVTANKHARMCSRMLSETSRFLPVTPKDRRRRLASRVRPGRNPKGMHGAGGAGVYHRIGLEGFGCSPRLACVRGKSCASGSTSAREGDREPPREPGSAALLSVCVCLSAMRERWRRRRAINSSYHLHTR